MARKPGGAKAHPSAAAPLGAPPQGHDTETPKVIKVNAATTTTRAESESESAHEWQRPRTPPRAGVRRRVIRGGRVVEISGAPERETR